MNRNGSAILATAILFSMLASSGVHQSPSDRRGNVSASPPSNHTRSEQQAPNPDDLRKQGESDYKRQIDNLFLQYCRDGDAAETAECNLQEDDFVIALIPDPVHTHLALAFDRTTDTIQEALQDDGYVFYRAIVPWDHETHPQPDDYKIRSDAKRYQEGSEHLPGIMLFRPSGEKTDAPKNTLAVMLVGETPTSGVDKEQFSKAVEQIRQRTPKKDKSEMKLRILGPTFSGSLTSLKKLLTCGQSRPCFRSATILSGTISGREEVEEFRETEHEVNAIFDTLQETDAVMLERLIEFIAGKSYGYHDYDVPHVAELSEDETAYGSMKQARVEYEAGSGYCKNFPAQSKNPAPSPDPALSQNAVQSQNPSPPRVCSILKLYFPREISQLRAAYQDSGSANAPERLPFQNLPHNFGVTGADDDTVASFSQKQTPLSQEAVLLSIVAELRKHAIEFVVLNATDPMDTLFLSHYLRSAYPQGRIVTMGVDMLFPREIEDTSLHGILALSTYSVSPSANHQFYQLRQSGAERMFPSSFEIGTYNALNSLMRAAKVSPPLSSCDPSVSKNECADQLQSNPEKSPLYLIQYGWRERGADKQFSRYNAPPVRLSALGHDGYWPIANLGPFEYPFAKEKIFTLLPQVVGVLAPQAVCDPQKEMCPPPVQQFTNDPAPVEVPTSWALVEVLGLALACGFSMSLWFASIGSPRQPLAQFAPTRAGGRVWLIGVAGVFLIFVLLILLWPFVHGHHDWVMTHARLHAGLLAVGMFAVFATTLLDISERSGLFYAVPRPGETTRSNLGHLGAMLAFTVASILLAYKSLTERNDMPENLAGIRHFETLRAIQLTSGLSPILPILFLLGAGLWWANHTARGWMLLDERRPRLPSGIQPLRIGEDGEIAEALLATLQPGFSSLTHYLALAGTVLGICLLLHNLPPFRMIEPFRLEVTLNFFLALAWAGLVGTTLRLWNIWFRAHQLLVALDSLPLRRAFRRLEGFSWKPIWKFGGSGALAEYQRILAREREALQSAANVLPELEDPKQKIDLARQRALAEYEAARAHGQLSPFQGWGARRNAEQRVIKQFGRFQEGVALAARVALVYLADRWQHEKEEPRRHRGQESADELKVCACERFVSLLYVSFLLVVLARMRSLITAIGGMYIFILLAMTLYPFEPRPAIQAFLAASLVFIVVVVGLVFAQIHRDAVLSHITETKPGELGGDFYLRMASFLALPLFSFFAFQFPAIGRFFYSWLEPALQALNR